MVQLENIACRAELERYPLSIDITASIFSYWLRLQQKNSQSSVKGSISSRKKSQPIF